MSKGTGDWSRLEVEATVADYFSMLEKEIRGERYNKAGHNRDLEKLLNDRSKQSIEFKHCNISAILNELGFPYISGYKPRSNYQRLLLDVVKEWLDGPAAQPVVQSIVDDAESAVVVPTIENILAAMVMPPKIDRGMKKEHRNPSDPFGRPFRPPIDYLDREVRNQSLGQAGEEFVLNFERARLIKANREKFADRIDHVSKEVGDWCGFDIHSFETDGRDRFIEVKTTKNGIEMPFFVTRNEVKVSREVGDLYHLYRVFDFRRSAKIFSLAGPLDRTCLLDPSVFVASVA